MRRLYESSQKELKERAPPRDASPSQGEDRESGGWSDGYGAGDCSRFDLKIVTLVACPVTAPGDVFQDCATASGSERLRPIETVDRASLPALASFDLEGV